MEFITKEKYDELKSIDKNTVKKFSLESKIFIGKIVDVYDGDTCKVVIFFKNEFMKFNIRMSGYDTPELKTKNDIEKSYSQISKKMLEKLVLNKIVKLRCYDFDKYGRLLGSIVVINSDKGEELDVNNFMIEHHFGYSYFGDKKQDFNELLEYYKDIKVLDIETTDYKIDFDNYNEISLSNESVLTNNIIDIVDKLNENKNNKCLCTIS